MMFEWSKKQKQRPFLGKKAYGSVCPIFQTHVTAALQILLEIIYTVELQKSDVARVKMKDKKFCEFEDSLWILKEMAI